MGVGGQHQAPASLTLGKAQCSLYRRLGSPQGRSGRGRKTLPLPEIELRTVYLYRFAHQIIKESIFFNSPSCLTYFNSTNIKANKVINEQIISHCL